MNSEEVKRLSHDFKNALNGITVNLEVLRTRLSKDHESLLPFVNNASDQLEKLTSLSKQLLAMAQNPNK